MPTLLSEGITDEEKMLILALQFDLRVLLFLLIKWIPSASIGPLVEIVRVAEKTDTLLSKILMLLNNNQNVSDD